MQDGGKSGRILLRCTVVVSASEKPDFSCNQIWAATFQLAWDELRKLAGGPSSSTDPCR